MTSSTANKWQRDWLPWLLVGTILYSLVCLVSLATDIGRPFPGFFTYNNLILGRIDMVRNAPAWWWGLTDTEPHITDVLLRVEDTPFDGLTTLLDERPIYQQAWENGQTSVTVTVARDGEELALQVPLVRFSWRHYLDFMFASIIIAATLIQLAWLLYRAAPTDPTQRTAAAMLCLMALIAIGIHPSLFHYDQALDRLLSIGNITTTAAALAFAPVAYQFALRFPYPLQSPRWQIGTWLLSGLALVNLVIYGMARLQAYTVGLTPLAKQLDWLYFNLWLGLLLTGVLVIFVRTAVDSFKPQTPRRFQQEARVLFAALILMLPATLLVGHYLVNSSAALTQLQVMADSRFFPLALPLAFAAISLRYHTFAGAETRFLLALLLAASGLLANIGTALLFSGQLVLIRETAVPPTVILFLLFFTIGLIWGWQSGWRGWLGRVFHWERVNYQVVQHIGERLLSAPHPNTNTVAQLVADVFCDELEVSRVAVWLYQNEQLRLTAVAGQWQQSLPQQLPMPPAWPHHPHRWQEAAPVWSTQLTDPIMAVVPLTIDATPLGLVLIGPRWDTAVFDDRDLEILALNSQQATLFLQSARQTQQLRQADRQLLAAHTHARQKIAQDLHDHLLPALSRLQLDLLTANQLVQANPTQAQQTLHKSQQDLVTSSILVRRVQQDLVARPLTYGLQTYLDEIVQRFTDETGVPVQHTLPPDLEQRVQDLQVRETIYAIWKQALDNIQRHAQATQVTITLQFQADRATFHICDNGQGSRPEEIDKAQQAGHFGLRSMQIRLEAIAGQWHFESKVGQGTCVSGSFPLQPI